MINQPLKGLVDLIYGTGRVRRKFELDKPDEKVLAADASKGIVTTTNQDIQRGLDWVTSQRAVVLLTDKKCQLTHGSRPATSSRQDHFLPFILK